VARPLPSLWQLGAVDLAADAVVEFLPERNRKSKRVHAAFRAPLATELLSGRTTTLGAPLPLNRQSARIEFPALGGGEQGALGVWRLEVPAEVRVDYKDRAGLTQKGMLAAAPSVGRAGESATWTLWTHGLGGEPLSDWSAAVGALCEDALAMAQDPAKPVRPPQNDLRTIVRRAVKDGIVTVTELSLLVTSVRRVCGGAFEARSRPVQVQSE
jgi:hypothetical protein